MQRYCTITEGGILKISGRSICRGTVTGTVLKLDKPLSFLGEVDPVTGILKVRGDGCSVAEKILVFPRGKGSTVGSFVMYDLKVHGNAPKAIINTFAEIIVATGAVISSIPMVDMIDTDLINDGDKVIVDANSGTVEIEDIIVVECVSSVIIMNGKILILKRSPNVRSYSGMWGLCSGKIKPNEKPEIAAIREIYEETGIKVSRSTKTMDPIFVRENRIIWKVIPFLFYIENQNVKLNCENNEYKFVNYDELIQLNLVDKTVEIIKKFLKN